MHQNVAFPGRKLQKKHPTPSRHSASRPIPSASRLAPLYEVLDTPLRQMAFCRRRDANGRNGGLQRTLSTRTTMTSPVLTQTLISLLTSYTFTLLITGPER